jgi:uncharacterized protein (DUF779 family)
MEVAATARAEDAVRRVAAGGRTDLVMVLGNGCCDSTAPYLYDHYVVGPDAAEVGRVAEVPVMAPAWLRTLYPDDALTVDVDDGAGSDSFSLESALDLRFTLRLTPPTR